MRRFLVLAIALLAAACGSTPLPTPNSTAAITALPTSTPSPQPTQPITPQATDPATPAPTTSPTPRPTATPIDYEGWTPLSVGGEIDYRWLAWSPDSRYLTVPRDSIGEPASVAVFTRDGAPVQTFVDFDEALWLDSQRLVLTRYADGAPRLYNETRQPEGAISFLATIGSDAVEATNENLGASETSGAGALAVPTCWVCRPNVGYYREVAFRLWTPDAGFS